ncbi:MAG: class I SAM-dependent methyltransferase [Kiritimatiellia bacterium]
MTSSLISTLAASRSIPARILDLPSAWTGHIPFAHWLGTTLQPGQFVELGTHYGHSYFNFCEAIKTGRAPGRCFAVDTWEGDEHAGRFRENLYEEVKDFNQTHYAGFSTLLRMTFDEALEQIADGSVDLLHIDGYHTYEAVKHDFESWRPKLQAHAVVLFHDTRVRQHNFGVWKLWEEVCAEYDLTFEFTHYSGLGVLQLEPQANSALSDFWREVKQSPEWLRDYFNFLGNRVAERSALYRERKEKGETLPEDFNHAMLATGTSPDQLMLEVVRNIYEGKEPDTKLTDEIQILKEKLMEEKDRRAAAQRKLEAVSGVVAEQKLELHDKVFQIQQLACQLQEREKYCKNLSAGIRPFIHYSYQQRASSFYLYFHLLQKLEARFPRLTLFLSTPGKLLWWSLSGQIVRKIKTCRDAKTLLDSEWFDPVQYLEENGDVYLSGMNPVHHWLEIGWKQGYLPHPEVDVNAYMELNPDVAAAKVNPLVHYIQNGRAEGRKLPKPKPVMPIYSDLDLSHLSKIPKVSELIRERFPEESPIPIYRGDLREPCLTLVTDSINAGSLFGGVGTAILLGIEISNRLHIPLRILTLTEPAQSENVAMLLEAHGLEMTQPLSFDHVACPDRSIPVHPEDLYLSTSWWSTRRLLNTVATKNILYLLQEDERMFYAHGDDWLRCHEVLNHAELKILVNSRNLYMHLCEQGCENLRRNGFSFEPAFPHGKFRKTPRPVGAKKKFFFYARPHHDRNLFYRGLEVVNEVMARSILSPDEWDIYFAGHHIPDMVLPGGVKPKVLENLSWKAYCEEVSDMDLGLSLMLSPHTSYPPLDLAAAGAYVVTNQFGLKRNLSTYSNRILCVPVTKEHLVDGLRKAVQLSQGNEEFSTENSTLPHNWKEAFAPVIDWVGESV